MAEEIADNLKDTYLKISIFNDMALLYRDW